MPGLPPGPGTAPILQTLAWIRRPAELLEECRSRYGAIFTLTFAGGRKFVMLADPEDVKGVFGGSPDVFLSGRANQTFKPFMGEHSLLVLDGAPHRRHRRLLMPPFQGARMRAYGPLIANVTQQFVDAWPEGRPFSLYDAMKEITLRIIFHAIFGVSDEARALELTRLVALSTGRAPALLNFVPALQRDLGSWSPWGRFLRARRRLDAILDEEIASARRDGGGREDILARLCAAPGQEGDPFSDAEIKDELRTLLGAGHETTTAGLSWAFSWALGLPDVKARLEAEVRENARDLDRVAELPYLDGVINEALRLHPPIPIVVRYAAADVPVGGFTLPAGTIVCPCPYLAHRDARVFAEPLRFLPERFAGGRPAAHELFPFGGGSRTCIGLSFAIHEMAVVMATVLSRVELSRVGPPSGRSRRRSIILAPVDGPRVLARRRLA